MSAWPTLLRDNRYFRPLLLIVAVIGSLWLAGSRIPGGQPQAQAKVAAQVGFVAPDFALAVLDGQTTALSSQRGKVVLLNFWAAWCAPCRSEMPAINRIYQKYRDAGLVVLAVNAAYQDNETDAVALARGLGLSFPVLFDRDGSTGRAYNLRSLPTTHFIGRNGVVREIVVGAMSETILEARVKRLVVEGN